MYCMLSGIALLQWHQIGFCQISFVQKTNTLLELIQFCTKRNLASIGLSFVYM